MKKVSNLKKLRGRLIRNEPDFLWIRMTKTLSELKDKTRAKMLIFMIGRSILFYFFPHRVTPNFLRFFFNCHFRIIFYVKKMDF